MKIKDHLGNEFPSAKTMCRHWNIKYTVYKHNIKHGYSVEDALTIGADTPGIPRVYKDHLGNEFNSITDMCKYWGIDKSIYMARIRYQWSQKDALTKPIRKRNDCKDHLGQEFKSTKDMCRYWNISYSTYLSRIKAGWSIEDALTVQENKKMSTSVSCKDHLGQEFKSIKEMCRHWHINHQTYKNRTEKKGWPVKKALTTWSANTRISDNCTILKQINDDYYECLLNNEKVIMSCEQIRSIKP